MADDQTEVIAFLGGERAHKGARVERIETHISVVFLAGSRAWKLKRAVCLDYIDSSTPGKRRTLCEKEVLLNRRMAPSLYLGVVAVTREADGSLSLGGSGTAIDWVVEMNRFDQDALFDRLALQGRLDLAMATELATTIAAFHRTVEPRPDHGGLAGMRWVVDGNASGLSAFGRDLFDAATLARTFDHTRNTLERFGPQLESRREAGYVRQCHGDLHLRNIVLHQGRPMLFDGIEFNDEIACVDVLYDLAFLLMDLWRRRLPVHANTVWNRYLGESGELDGVGLMPLFLSCRAAVRAKTSATALAVQTEAVRAPELRTAARDYLAMAERLLDPPPPCLVAIGGLSGTGKSTMAAALAPLIGAVPGAIVWRSDEIRKRFAGVPPHVRLGSEAYSTEATDRVYDALRARAGVTLQNGYTVVVDATFLRAGDREAMEAVARAADVPFVGLWLEGPLTMLHERLLHRQHDASDANSTVLERQYGQELGEISWHRLDASKSVETIRVTALSLLGGCVNDARDSS